MERQLRAIRAARIHNTGGTARGGYNGDKVWLVGSYGAPLPVWAEYVITTCKTWSAYTMETYIGNGKPERAGGSPAGRSAQWQRLLATELKDTVCVAREDGRACR